MISVEEAFERIVGKAKPLQTERLHLTQSVGRVLAAPLAARKSQPGWPLSAMDGYAVLSSDLNEKGRELYLSGEIPAGATDIPFLKTGETYRIFTGAPVPENADQVIIQENVSKTATGIKTFDAPKPDNNIRAAGIDFSEKQVICDAGSYISPKSIGLIAGAGYDHVMVHRAPRVAILTTGDELAPADKASFGPSETVNSNTPMLAAFLSDAGAALDIVSHVPDDRNSTEAAINEAKDVDILITVGGVSVGDHDHVRPGLEAQGVTLDFWKIAMRPGKPLVYGKQGDKHVIGLPGNPVSAFVCALLFVRPLIDAVMGRPAPMPKGVELPCAVNLPANGPRQHYMRARLVGDPGKRRVDPAASQDSSLLSVLAQSDGLLVRAPNAEAVTAGSMVPFIPF